MLILIVALLFFATVKMRINVSFESFKSWLIVNQLIRSDSILVRSYGTSVTGEGDIFNRSTVVI